MRAGDGDGVVCESGSVAPARATGAGTASQLDGLRRDHPNGVPRDHSAYQRRMDRDNDGRACEGWRSDPL